MTLDFVRLNAATGGLEGWPIPNIQQIMARLGTLKPTMFALLDFTAGYSRKRRDTSQLSWLWYQWTRVAMELLIFLTFYSGLF